MTVTEKLKTLFVLFLLTFSIPSFSAESININTASAEELAENLSGIGLKKAQAIINYRQQHGDFVAIEELAEVRGISDRTLEKNQSIITIE